MKVLLKSARITDVESPHNNTSKDILISNGHIENIATSISDPDALILSIPELFNEIAPTFSDAVFKRSLSSALNSSYFSIEAL
jgi:hypothetical protein